MSRPLGKLSPGEFEIMEVLWKSLEERTTTEILQAVNATRTSSPLKRATVQVIVRRLEDKGWLNRREEDRKFSYLPTAGREAASAALAGELTNRVFDGSCSELVRCLFEHQKVSADEISRLRDLLDEVDNPSKD